MIKLTMEIQKLEEKHAEDMRMLLMEKHAEIQKLHMDQNEHLKIEMQNLNKILSDHQKLKKKDAEEINKLQEYLRITWELNDGLKKEIAELKSAVAGSAAALMCHLQPMVVFPKTTDRADWD